MAIKNILILIVRGLTLDVRIWRLTHVEVYTHRIRVQLYFSLVAYILYNKEKSKKMMLGAYNKVFLKNCRPATGLLIFSYKPWRPKWFFNLKSS